MPRGEESDDLFLGELGWGLSSYLFHPPLADLNLTFGVDGTRTSIRWEVWDGQPVNGSAD